MKELVNETIFLYDILSRDDVWQIANLGLLKGVLNLLGVDQSAAVDPRQSALSGLNHIADVLVDEIQPAALAGTTTGASGFATPKSGLALSYLVGSRGVYRVAIDPAGRAIARYVPIAERDLSEMCSRFRTAIEERKEFASVSAQLYEILLGEIPELDAVQNLYLSPDGPLNFIPFQALKTPAGTYLVEHLIVGYLTGAVAPVADQTLGGNKRIVLVGNPDGTLAAAENEVRRIAELPGLEAGDPLLRSTATFENLRNRLSDVSLVHFATHAWANESYPNFSYLQLANWDWLYSIDLGGLRFSGKHIFLSACKTRLGQNLPGNDIYGIADAFLASGASSVISTLWRIESDSSALFAQRYYALLAQTQSAPAALAMTAREFIHGKLYLERGGMTTTLDKPVYWAGFNHLVPGLVALISGGPIDVPGPAITEPTEFSVEIRLVERPRIKREESGMEYPVGLRYTKTHEWVRVEDKLAYVGITDYAQQERGDVVYVELPKVGAVVRHTEPFGVVESLYAVSDLYSPVTGTVLHVNEKLFNRPELVNGEPYDQGWMIVVEIADPLQLNTLMTAEQYKAYLSQR